MLVDLYKSDDESMLITRTTKVNNRSPQIKTNVCSLAHITTKPLCYLLSLTPLIPPPPPPLRPSRAPPYRTPNPNYCFLFLFLLCFYFCLLLSSL